MSIMPQDILLRCCVLVFVTITHTLAHDAEHFLSPVSTNSVPLGRNVSERQRESHLSVDTNTHMPEVDAHGHIVLRGIKAHRRMPHFSLASIESQAVSEAPIATKASDSARCIYPDEVGKAHEAFDIKLGGPKYSGCTGDARQPAGETCKIECNPFMAPSWSESPSFDEVTCKCKKNVYGVITDECLYNSRSKPTCSMNAKGWAAWSVVYTCPLWCCGGLFLICIRANKSTSDANSDSEISNSDSESDSGKQKSKKKKPKSGDVHD